MKVLLFTQHGDGPLKCAPTTRSMTRGDAQHVREMFESKPTPKSPPWMKALDAADRYVLVECANADAGRAAIALYVDFRSHLDWKLPRQFGPGCILASGGRA